MATIAYDGQSPGASGSRPAFWQSARPIKVVTGTFTFDTSYPTGGEDISDIFNQFQGIGSTSGLLGIHMADPTGSAGTGKSVVIDYTAKKALLYTNAAPPVQVADTSDQSGAANLRFIAWGYWK